MILRTEKNEDKKINALGNYKKSERQVWHI